MAAMRDCASDALTLERIVWSQRARSASFSAAKRNFSCDPCCMPPSALALADLMTPVANL